MSGIHPYKLLSYALLGVGFCVPGCMAVIDPLFINEKTSPRIEYINGLTYNNYKIKPFADRLIEDVPESIVEMFTHNEVGMVSGAIGLCGLIAVVAFPWKKLKQDY